MKLSVKLILAAVTGLLVLASCGSPPPVERVPWEEDGSGYVQFRTNDKNDYDQYFIEVPADAGNALTTGPSSSWTVEADVIQAAGTTVGGHGMIVACNPAKTDFYVFVVNSEGYYALFSVASGIKGSPNWIKSPLIKGPYETNKLKAVYSGGGKIFFSINGTQVTTATYPNSGPLDTQAGLYNEILGDVYEGFPGYYSDRRFKLMVGDPVAYTYP